MELHVPTFWAFWSIYLHVITLLLFMTLLHPTIHTLVKALGNETDRIALLKFKEAITTDPHGFFNSWNDSFHLCNWHGITCGKRHQRVTALNLYGYDLQGTISPYIGNLSFLRRINLENNSFSGNIPQQLGHLFRLRFLSLYSNMLEGEIPVNLTFCSKLRVINLGSNHLITGTILSELGSLMKPSFLNLEKNNLIGSIPPSLGNLSSITILSLAYNNLVGSIPKEIGRLRSLSFFSITENNLSGIILPSLFNISSMINFSISGNNFNDSIPPGIGQNMPNLQILFLGGNEFSGKIPALFSNASHLQVLDISENNFVGEVPKFFGKFPDLWGLNLGINNLGSNSSNDLGFITSLTNCSNLEILVISYNNFGGVLPKSIANLSTQLITVLYLGGNQVSGIIPAALENLSNLIGLGMEDNLFTGVIPTSFGKFQRLQGLSLETNRLSGRIPSSIGNLTQLSELYLSANELEGNIPPNIGNCKNLLVMNIAQNRLSGDIPPQVIGLPTPYYLNLSRNSLTGSLLAEVGELKNINTLDISGNNLTGEIPEIIGDCLSLEYLYLERNLFQGIIPSSLASVRGLRDLDLSQNNLSNKIPKGLQRLPLLLYLNLSFNNLEGEVPKEGAFRNTSALSLVGNPKLCGGVSELKLPACPIKSTKQRKIHGFNLKLTISLVVGCSLLFAFMSALYWRRKSKKKQLSVVSSMNFISKVSYQALHQATNGFSLSSLVGSGGFGSVYKAILDQEENNVIAIKVFNLQKKGASKSFMTECNALRNIRHRNLVKILTCCSSTDYNGNEFKALAFEYMSNGSLEDWLHRGKQSRSLNLRERLNIVVDVASALCYLHGHCEPPIIHCDMKPSNVLLDDDMVARVSDFGLARLISITTKSSQTQSSTIGIKGTIGYVAPEYASGVETSRQGDVYSYGILTLEMFTGRRPTDEIFKDGLNLHNFVKMEIPGRLVQIIDPALLATLEETAPATTENKANYRENGYINEIEAEEENIDYENLSKMNAYLWKCILPILKIGLACSEESPKSRMCMEDVTRNLHNIQNAFNVVEICRKKPRKS